MAGLIKSLIPFWKTEPSDDELLQKWFKSGKTPDDFNTSILKMKSNTKVIIGEISQVKLKTMADLQSLLGYINKNEYSSIQKTKLVYIIDSIQFILRLHTLTKNDSLVYFAFSSKYDIFSFIAQNIIKVPELNQVISEVYYKKEVYIDLVQYYISNDSEKELKILLPNESNCNKLIESNSIPSQFDIKKLFKQKFQAEIDSMTILWFNLVLYFHSNIILFNGFKNYLPHENKAIEIIFEVYTIANDIESIDLISFINKPFELSFEKIIKVESKERFEQLTKRLLGFIKKYRNDLEKIDLMPFFIIKSLLENKTQNDILIIFLTAVFQEGLYQPTKLKNFILKYLLENYTDSLLSSLQLVNILKKIDTSMIKIGNLCLDVENAVKFLSILDKEKIDINLTDVMKSNYLKADILLSSTQEYLWKITNEFKYGKYNFIDSHREDIGILIDYCNNANNNSSYRIGYFLSMLSDLYPLFKKNIINVIQSNESLKLSEEEMIELLKKFLTVADDIKLKETIAEFLPIISHNKELYEEMNLVLTYIHLKEVFKNYQIPEDLLDCGYNNVQPDKILEIFLIKTFDIDQITSIESFINHRPIKDIQEALKLTNDNLLYLLFIFFEKYKRDTLYGQVLHLIKIEPKLFMDCIKVIRKNKSQQAFLDYIEKNDLKTYLLEHSRNFSLFYNDKIFNTQPHVNFLLSKDSLDILSILAIERLGLVPKQNHKSNPRLNPNDDYSKEQEVIEKFYEDNENNRNKKTLENLIQVYHEKIIETKSQVNYNYSLHPKLIDLLNQLEYGHLIQNVKSDFGSKIKLYNFLIINNIIVIEHVYSYESLSTTMINTASALKMIFNLYNDKTMGNIDKFLQGKQLMIETSQITPIINELIQINLTKLKQFNYNNLQFLAKYLSFDLNTACSLPVLPLQLMKVISHICPKFILLPFLSNFISEIYPKNKATIDRYYSDYYPMMNVNFFMKENDIQRKYQYVEIYKNISLSNWVNFSKIFNQLGKMEVNVRLILIIKLCYNFSNSSGVLISQAKNGCNYLMNIITSLKLNLDEIKLICDELYSYPQLTSILEGSQNILLLSENVPKNIKNYSSSKMLLATEIITAYSQLNEIPIYTHKYKIFKIKNTILLKVPMNETKSIYNQIRSMSDFNELNSLMKQYPKIQREIYDLYTSQL